MSSARLLLGFGNPLLDCTVPAIGRFDLGSLGIASGSHARQLPECTKASVVDSALVHPDRSITLGGSVLNTLRVFRRAFGHNATEGSADVQCAFVGAVGDDDRGLMLKQECTKAGIRTNALQTIKGMRTGVCACLVDHEGERTLVTQRGAAAHIESSPITKPNEPMSLLLHAACAIYVSSFVLSTDNRRSIASHLASLAHKQQIPLCLNLSSSSLMQDAQVVGVLNRDLLPRCKVVFGNKAECAALLGPQTRCDSSTLASRLSQLLPVGGIAVVTDGPAAVVYAEHTPEHPTVVCKPPPRVPLCELVDTNGAGDAFVGGWLSAFLSSASSSTSNQKLRECVDAGYRCAENALRDRGISHVG